MEQPSRCKFREPPSTVNVVDPQRQGGRRGPAGDGWRPRRRPVSQVGVRIFPRGVPIDLAGNERVYRNEEGCAHLEQSRSRRSPSLASPAWESPRSPRCHPVQDSCVQRVDLDLVRAAHLA